jgi:XTP/dITP diphosphohydrolase
MKIVFATSNKNKIIEIKSIAPAGFEIIGIEELGFVGDIPETKDTIEGNSLQKAEFISHRFNIPCFAEDTGLEVEALDGKPGVYSARFAGENATDYDNVEKLLSLMQGKSNRKARFKTVITYYNDGTYVQFEGTAEGNISEVKSGNKGFGYDPVFLPLGSNSTFAEMELEEKNNYSHRKKSFAKFATFLSGLPV